MPMLTGEYFAIRTSISHHYSAPSGTFATPKLYRKSHAIRYCKELNARSHHPEDGPWEVVPVTITFGDPVPLEK